MLASNGNGCCADHHFDNQRLEAVIARFQRTGDTASLTEIVELSQPRALTLIRFSVSNEPVPTTATHRAAREPTRAQSRRSAPRARRSQAAPTATTDVLADLLMPPPAACRPEHPIPPQIDHRLGRVPIGAAYLRRNKTEHPLPEPIGRRLSKCVTEHTWNRIGVTILIGWLCTSWLALEKSLRFIF